MAYKQDGFLTSLLTNFRKRKDFKYDVKDSRGAYNKESNTVNVKQGEEIIKMPMRKYTKKALSDTPKLASDENRLVRDVGGTARPAYVMEFSEESTFSEPKKQKSRTKKYKYPKSKKKKGLYLKKGKFIN